MQKKSKMITLIIIILLSIISIPVSSDTLSVGAGPSNIYISLATKGESYNHTIFVQNVGKKDVDFNLSVEGEINNWTSIYEKNDTKTPITKMTVKRNSTKKLTAKFTIPEVAANGEYSGIIYAKPITQKANKSGQATVQLKLPINVVLQVVGKQYLAGEVGYITTSDIEKGRPLIIDVLFENKGNVIAKPTIEVKIIKDNNTIKNLNYSEESVDVGEEEEISAQWKDIDLDLGIYTANVIVFFNESILKEKNLSFEILPRGTFTREGKLEDLYYEGDPSIGELVKVVCEFENTGDIETTAKFVGEVYVNDKLLDTIESEEVLVPKYRNAIFTTYIKIEQYGKYTLKGYVQYETNRTSTKSISFQVEQSLRNIFSPINIAIIVGISICIIFIFIKREKIVKMVKQKSRKGKSNQKKYFTFLKSINKKTKSKNKK